MERSIIIDSLCLGISKYYPRNNNMIHPIASCGLRLVAIKEEKNFEEEYFYGIMLRQL